MCPNPNRIAPPHPTKPMPHTRLTILVNFTRSASYWRPERRLRASGVSCESLIEDYDRVSQDHGQKGGRLPVPSQDCREGVQDGHQDAEPPMRRERGKPHASYARLAAYPSSWRPREAISAYSA